MILISSKGNLAFVDKLYVKSVSDLISYEGGIIVLSQLSLAVFPDY
jgi:hypothetical protein